MIPYAIRTAPAIRGNFEPLLRFRTSDRPSFFIAQKEYQRTSAIRIIPEDKAYREGYKLFESELEAYRYWLKESESLNDLTNWSGDDKYSGAAYQEAGEVRPIPLSMDDAANEYITVAINMGATLARARGEIQAGQMVGVSVGYRRDDAELREAARSAGMDPGRAAAAEALERNIEQRPIVINMGLPSASIQNTLGGEEFRRRVEGEWSRTRNGSVFQEDPRSFQWFRDDGMSRGSRANHSPIIEPVPARQAEPGDKLDGMTYYTIRCESCGSRRRLAAPNTEAGWIVTRALERAANEMREERCG